jgi:hypothetical protein
MASEEMKDFVEHIRSVHFALAAISIGLVIVVLGNRTSELNKAHEQIWGIIEFSPMLKKDLLAEAADETLKNSSYQNPPPSAKRFLELSVGKARLPVELTFGSENAAMKGGYFGRNWFVEVYQSDEVGGSFARNADWQSGLVPEVPTPKTLGQFRDVWDVLQGGVQIVFPSWLGDALVRADRNDFLLDRTAKRYKFDGFTTSAPLRDKNEILSKEVPIKVELALSPYIAGAFQVSSNPPLLAAYCGQGHGNTNILISVCFPIRDEPGRLGLVPLRTLPTLLRQRPDLKWHDAKFATAFRELDSVTKDYPDVSLSTAERIIASELRRTGDSFEVLSLKIPADATIYWGIFLLLATQLYFWVHLKEFKRRTSTSDPSVNSAWIALYPSRAASILVFLSAIALPVIANCILVYRGASSISPNWAAKALIFSIPVGIFISIRSAANLPQSR